MGVRPACAGGNLGKLDTCRTGSAATMCGIDPTRTMSQVRYIWRIYRYTVLLISINDPSINVYA
jgi:hypothetical protein